MTESPIVESSCIQGVYTVPLPIYQDERGSFMETFRREWFPFVSWDRLQSNRSVSKAGVLRGLHYHFQQIDYWYVPQGEIRAGLVDLRPGSPTHMQSEVVDMGGENSLGLFIPIGVAHGFISLTDSMLVYVVNNYYDGGKDEYGVAWNDADANLNWGIDAPTISERDQQNPFIRDVPPDDLPK